MIMYSTNTMIALLALIGLLIATYMIYAKTRKSKNTHYRAICDLSDRVSCTKVFETKYSRLLGVPNALLGGIMYFTIFILANLGYPSAVTIISGLGVLMSAYLAYGLVKEKIVCIMCIASYVITCAIFILSW